MLGLASQFQLRFAFQFQLLSEFENRRKSSYSSLTITSKNPSDTCGCSVFFALIGNLVLYVLLLYPRSAMYDTKQLHISQLFQAEKKIIVADVHVSCAWLLTICWLEDSCFYYLFSFQIHIVFSNLFLSYISEHILFPSSFVA